MFRQAIRVTHQEFPSHSVGDSDEVLPTDSRPTETCIRVLSNYLEYRVWQAYIPSALSESVSITSLLSSSRHLRIFVSE